jgi:hypothetical protein
MTDKRSVLGEKLVPGPPCPPQIPQGLARHLTRAFAMRSWLLIPSAMARAIIIIIIIVLFNKTEDMFSC